MSEPLTPDVVRGLRVANSVFPGDLPAVTAEALIATVDALAEALRAADLVIAGVPHGQSLMSGDEELLDAWASTRGRVAAWLEKP